VRRSVFSTSTPKARRSVDLLDLEKCEKDGALDAKIGVDTAENEPNVFMAYAMGIGISYLQARFTSFQTQWR
jgi:hypothetical protein